jgi:hypothetical protein
MPSRIFADFLALVIEERSYASSILSDPQTILSAFVQSTLDALSPSLSQRLSGLVGFYGAAVVETKRPAPDAVKNQRGQERRKAPDRGLTIMMLVGAILRRRYSVY